jgi:hypothetical protein
VAGEVTPVDPVWLVGIIVGSLAAFFLILIIRNRPL